MIRNVCPDRDAGAICRIYDHYIRETVITFETEPLSEEAMRERIAGISSRFPYLVFEGTDGQVIGYCYATTWRTRAAYDRTVELAVYLDKNHTGRGIGRLLYQALLGQLKEEGFHVAIGSITLPNPASVALHEKLGFGKVAHFSEVGRKFDRWLDVGFWELRL